MGVVVEGRTIGEGALAIQQAERNRAGHAARAATGSRWCGSIWGASPIASTWASRRSTTFSSPWSACWWRPRGRLRALSFELVPGGEAHPIGPLREGAIAEALRDPRHPPGELSLSRILRPWWTRTEWSAPTTAAWWCGSRLKARRERAPRCPDRPREDRELLRRYHEGGDTSAREELIQRHLPLVRSLARRYAGRGEAMEDIEQVGAIGLIKAIDRFELARDVALTTYATPNVVGEIKRHFRDKGWAIRVPRAPPGAERVDVPTVEP